MEASHVVDFTSGDMGDATAVMKDEASNSSFNTDEYTHLYGEGRNKRRRMKTNRYENADYVDNEEQKLIQQAIRNSQTLNKRLDIPVPDAPIYYPTIEEFADPLGYINKIRPDAEKYGICKIVPPKQWRPHCLVNLDNTKKFATKKQQIETLQEGQGFDEGKDYTIREYKEMADKFYSEWCAREYGTSDMKLSAEMIVKEYWDMVETGTKRAVVEYGNDIDTLKYTSGFDYRPSGASGVEADVSTMFTKDYYVRTGWNLNNLPFCDKSVLKYLDTPINGVNVPWLYIGMLFTSFCWHNEDNYLYSINYCHFGETKQWYGVPGVEAKAFEKVTKNFLMESFRESPDLLHHMTTQISPSLLQQHGVPVYAAQQTAGTFMVTFPKAFHAGFSHGFNVGEAVNFASHDWLVAGGESEERYRQFGRTSVFSHHRLLFTLLQNQDDVPTEDLMVELATEVVRVLDEEIPARHFIVNQGIGDISTQHQIKLPDNKFNKIDREAADFDDMRQCHVCKHICVFSAVACECDKAAVSCIRHYSLLCKCSKEHKYLLTWTATGALRTIQNSAKELVKNKGRKSSSSSSATTAAGGLVADSNSSGGIISITDGSAAGTKAEEGIQAF